MRVFKWKAAHPVYLPEIDAGHRAIFQSAGELQKAIEGSAPTERILEILRALIAHSEDHFKHEERLMQSTRYMSGAWHKQQHDTARKRLRTFMRAIAAGKLENGQPLLDFLGTWMQDHIGVADSMLGAYLRNYERSHAA